MDMVMDMDMDMDMGMDMDMDMDMDMGHGVGMGAVCACECAARVHVSRRPHTPTEDGYLRIVMERLCGRCKGVPSAKACQVQMRRQHGS